MRLRSWLETWRPELRQSIRTLVSVFLSDLVSHALHLREPYWALITAVIVTQARITATLETGRDQILGTLIGAVAGAAAIVLAGTGLSKPLVFSGLLVPLALLAAFKPNLRLAGVTLVVVFLFPSQGGLFARPVDRVLAILVGAGVSMLVSYLVFHTRARGEAFRAAAAMLDRLDLMRAGVLDRRVAMAEAEQLNDDVTDTLRLLIAALAEARRERLTATFQHEPLMVRLVPMLRRLQSDMLFVARGLDETHGPANLPELSPVSCAMQGAFSGLRAAFLAEAAGQDPDRAAARAKAAALHGAVDALGDHAGPLPRFTLTMLVRDVDDVARSLDPEQAQGLYGDSPSGQK